MVDEKSCCTRPLFWELTWLDTDMKSISSVRTMGAGVRVDSRFSCV